MFGDLKSAAGVKALDEFLTENSYIEGFVPSQADTAVFEALAGAPESDTPHALRWYNHVKSFGAGMKQIDSLLGACDEDDSKLDKYIASLPREMQTMIFSFLTTADLKNAVLVSKTWRDMGEHPSLWRKCQVRVSSMIDLDKLVNTRRLQMIGTINIRGLSMSADGNAFFKEITTQSQLVQRLPNMKILGLHFNDLRSVEPHYLAPVLCSRQELVLAWTYISDEQLQAIFTNIEASDQRALKLKKLSTLPVNREVFVEPVLFSRAVTRFVEVKVGKLSDEQALAVFTAVSGGESKIKILEVDDYNCERIDDVILAKAVKTLEKLSAASTYLTSKQTRALFGDGLRGSKLKQLGLFGADFGEVSPGAFSEAVNKLEVFTVEEHLNITNEQVEKLFQVMANATALKTMRFGYISGVPMSSVPPVILAKASDNLEKMTVEDLTSDQAKLVFKHIVDGNEMKRLWIRNTNLTTLEPEVLAVGVNKLEVVLLEDCEKEIIQVVAILEQLVEGTQLDYLSIKPSVKDMLPEELVTRVQAKVFADV